MKQKNDFTTNDELINWRLCFVIIVVVVEWPVACSVKMMQIDKLLIFVCAFKRLKNGNEFIVHWMYEHELASYSTYAKFS